MLAKVMRQLIRDLQENAAWDMSAWSVGKPSRMNPEQATTPSTEITTELHPLVMGDLKTLRFGRNAKFHPNRT